MWTFRVTIPIKVAVCLSVHAPGNHHQSHLPPLIERWWWWTDRVKLVGHQDGRTKAVRRFAPVQLVLPLIFDRSSTMHKKTCNTALVVDDNC